MDDKVEDTNASNKKQALLDWAWVAVIIGICVYFGVNKLFTRVGFPSMLVMFGLVCVMSLFLRHVMDDVDHDKME